MLQIQVKKRKKKEKKKVDSRDFVLLCWGMRKRHMDWLKYDMEDVDEQHWACTKMYVIVNMGSFSFVGLTPLKHGMSMG